MNATTRRRFRPFVYAGQQGAVVLESVRVDGQEVLEGPTTDALDLSGTRPTSELGVTARYDVPDAIWETLPPGERDPEAIRVVLVAEEAATWLKASVPLTPRGTSFRGGLTLPARDLRDSIELQVSVARGRRLLDVGDGGFAADLGACLGKSDRLPIRLSEPRQAPGSFMSLRWQAFSEVDHLVLWVGMPYRLQLTADPPVLWLNAELPALRKLLNNTSTSGRAAVERELLFGTIGSGAWTALFAAAARGVSQDDEGDFAFAQGWHEEALTVVANHAYPEDPRPVRLSRLLQRILDANAVPDQWPLLQEEVGLALMRFLDLGTRIDRAAVVALQ